MFILTAVNNGISIIAGVIMDNLGWSYNFHILLPFVAVQFILVVLFVPEMTYYRRHIHDTDVPDLNEVSKEVNNTEPATEAPESNKENTESSEIEHVRSRNTPPPRRKSFWQRMAVSWTA